MNVKKIQAEDMNQAIRIISKEFGSDAVLLDVKRVRKKGLANYFKKPHYEVTVEYDPAKTPLARKLNTIKAISEQYKADAGGTKPAGEKGGAEKTAAAPQTDKPESVPPAQQTEKPVSSGPAAEKAPAETNEPGAQTGAKSDLSGIAVLTERLIGNRVEKDFAFAIAKQAAEYLSREPKLSAYEAFFSVISNHIAPAGNLFQKQERSTVLFLGTTGVGKTTSLVKIAADLSLNAKKKVGIINTDTYRIAAHEQLKIYSDILDIPVKAVYDGEMVVKAMQDLSDRDAILIDTPGKRPGDPEHRAFVETVLSNAKPDIVLLAVSAPTSFEACREIIDSYGFVRDYRLLITKIDEISAYGNLLNLCLYSNRELTYLTNGQNIPKDIEPAQKYKIARLILGKQ